MLKKDFHESHKMYIVYCSIAGFIAAWAISGMLTLVDIISHSPPGSFFGVIGFALGFYDPS